MPTVTPSDSREWLLECLARHVLTSPHEVRLQRQLLADMERKGSKVGADELRGAMRALHDHKQGHAVGP